MVHYVYGDFSGIRPNPTFEQLLDVVELVKNQYYTFLLTVSGSSSYGNDTPLSGTATEMNGEAVISVKQAGSTIPFRSTAIYPIFSILDPRYTFSAPLATLTIKLGENDRLTVTKVAQVLKLGL